MNPTSATAHPAISYAVRALNLQAHLYAVKLTIVRPAANQTLSLPVWIAGSYLLREFSKHLQHLHAQQDQHVVTLTQLDKCSWQADCRPDTPLELNYQVYAFDTSVRTAWLDSQRGFFNGTSLCLRVHGQEEAAHELTLQDDGLPESWQAATALSATHINARGFGAYRAHNYAELVDNPVELGTFWSGHFVAQGIAHRFIVAGAPPSFDGARLLADTQAICSAEIGFWHGTSEPPHTHYLFMLNAVQDGYGGLEHSHSTALICKRADLPRLGQTAGEAPSEGYTTLLGLISHEYFHTWNVKRLRPAEFDRYDYQRENYTRLLWFFEGFTSYYDDLLLHRAGLIDSAHYLKLLTKSINQLLQTPGRLAQSAAQASFDAWIKYYRPDENTSNATVSYYVKGALVALCLDLSLRQAGRTHLDAVMRALWQRCHGGLMTEDDLLEVLDELAGESFAERLAQWVHGTSELPLQTLLEQQGISYKKVSAQLSQRLGLRVTESNGLHIKSVLRDSPAERAGLAAGDEWLGITVRLDESDSAWRLTRLDDLPMLLGQSEHCQVLIARDGRLLTLNLTLPAEAHSIELGVTEPNAVAAWLGHSAAK